MFSVQAREPTSGLEPLYCSLRVIHQALQRLAGDCKYRKSSQLSAPGCPALLRIALPVVSEWCQTLAQRRKSPAEIS